MEKSLMSQFSSQKISRTRLGVMETTIFLTRGGLETGHSVYAENIVLSKLSEFRRAILRGDLIKYTHKMNYHVWTLKPRFSGAVIYSLSWYP